MKFLAPPWSRGQFSPKRHHPDAPLPLLSAMSTAELLFPGEPGSSSLLGAEGHGPHFKVTGQTGGSRSETGEKSVQVAGRLRPPYRPHGSSRGAVLGLWTHFLISSNVLVSGIFHVKLKSFDKQPNYLCGVAALVLHLPASLGYSVPVGSYLSPLKANGAPVHLTPGSPQTPAGGSSTAASRGGCFLWPLTAFMSGRFPPTFMLRSSPTFSWGLCQCKL